MPQCDRVGKVECVKSGKFIRRLSVGVERLNFCAHARLCILVWIFRQAASQAAVPVLLMKDPATLGFLPRRFRPSNPRAAAVPRSESLFNAHAEGRAEL